MACDVKDGATCEVGHGTTEDAAAGILGVENGAAFDEGSEGAGNGFGFREFGHSRLLPIDVDAVGAEFDGVGLETDTGVEVVRAGAAVELPGVPGAYDGSSVERAVGEGAAGVGAGSIKGMELAINIAEQEAGIAANDFMHLARRDFGLECHVAERHQGED